MQSGVAIQTIPNTPGVHRIAYTPGFSTVCSIGKAPFYGTLQIEYSPAELLLEFESFEAWLFGLSNQSTTIEDLCRLVFNRLTEALGDIPLSVTVHAMTTVHAQTSATITRENCV